MGVFQGMLYIDCVSPPKFLFQCANIQELKNMVAEDICLRSEVYRDVEKFARIGVRKGMG